MGIDSHQQAAGTGSTDISGHQQPPSGTMCWAPAPITTSSIHQASGTEHQVPETRHQAVGNGYRSMAIGQWV